MAYDADEVVAVCAFSSMLVRRGVQTAAPQFTVMCTSTQLPCEPQAFNVDCVVVLATDSVVEIDDADEDRPLQEDDTNCDY